MVARWATELFISLGSKLAPGLASEANHLFPCDDRAKEGLVYVKGGCKCFFRDHIALLTGALNRMGEPWVLYVW